jgi:intracellular sulfur oxidation DsrE/DsrF family protein
MISLIIMKIFNRIRNGSFLLLAILLLPGCEQEPVATTEILTPVNHEEAVIALSNPTSPAHVQTDTQFTIGNKRYLYDISKHSIDDLKLLLQRAEEINQAETVKPDNLEIVMILHGPDINWFTLENYDDNKELVDLAKRLDAFDIIDLKVCETTMDSLEIDRNQIPPFIEPVPYAPGEISRLSEEGYIHL